MNEETKIREILATPHPLVMTVEDWENHKTATESHICNESFVTSLRLRHWALLWPKPQNVLLRRNEKDKIHRPKT